MPVPASPLPDCPLCPRLHAFRHANRAKYPDWFNDPVPSFGPLTARLLIAGLAPGLQGANRTGRPFTGDWAGDLLYATLLKHGLAKGVYDERIDDTLELVDCRIANSVRCVPPQNKPEPSEIKTCRQFLKSELETLPNVKVIVALGKIAFDVWWRVLAGKGIVVRPRPAFGHGLVHRVAGSPTVIASYHPSRQNTNTGKLTSKMMDAVFRKAANLSL